MQQLQPSPLRMAYIRTSTHSERDLAHYFDMLRSCVCQSSPEQLKSGAVRHCFLLGTVDLRDAQVLDMLIAEIEARVPTDVDYLNPSWRFKYVSRSDFELRISRPRAATPAGQKLLKRCADKGITTFISGASDEECDEIMLKDSDYLIDPITVEHCHGFHTHYDKYFRPGIPEDNMLTNEEYDLKQHDASRYRLRNRYASHSWAANSGGFRGNGDNYRCNMCGGKCKRRQCRGEASHSRIEENKNSEEGEDRWREENLRLPEFGNAKWKDSTAVDMMWRYHLLRLPRYLDEKQWHSIDTFSGE